MSLVLDASVTLSWYFEDERLPAADAVLDKVGAVGAVVPPVWRLEVANGLKTAIRRKRIDKPFRDKALQHLGSLSIVVDFDADAHVWSTTLELADRHGLTLYDASYVDLALRRHLPIACLDDAMGRAAQAAGIRVLTGAL